MGPTRWIQQASGFGWGWTGPGGERLGLPRALTPKQVEQCRRIAEGCTIFNRHNSGRSSRLRSPLLHNFPGEDAAALVHDGIVQVSQFRRLLNVPVH